MNIRDDSRRVSTEMSESSLRSNTRSPRRPASLGGFARGAMWTGVGIALSTLCVFGSNLYLVGVVEPAVYADIVILTVLILMFSNLMRFGADRMMVAEVHAAVHVDGPKGGAARAADIMSFAILSGFTGGLLVSIPSVSGILGHSLSTPLSPVETAAVGLWFASDVIRLVAAETHRSQYRFKSAALGGYGVRAPTFLIILILLTVVKGSLSREDVIFAAAGSSLFVFLCATALLSRTVCWWRGNPFRSARRLWGGHLAMVVTTFAASLIGGADVWILGSTVPPERTATYGFAVALVSGLAVLATAITGGVAPYMASALAKGNHRQIQTQIIGYVRVAAILAAIGYICILLLARPLAVQLGGNSYRDITLFVAILGAGQVVNAWAGIAGAVLVVAQRYRLVMATTVVVSLTFTAVEAVAGFVFHSSTLVAISSGTATAILPVAGCIVLSRSMHIRTDVFGRR